MAKIMNYSNNTYTLIGLSDYTSIRNIIHLCSVFINPLYVGQDSLC